MLRGAMRGISLDKVTIWGCLFCSFLCASLVQGDDLEGKLVDEIRIVGLKHTKEFVVYRELVSRVGEPYTPEKVRKDAERLDRLRVFSSIQVRPVAKNGGVLIDIEVKETLPYLPTLSIQVNDENGVSVGPGVKSLNFLGRGIQLGAAVQFGAATNMDFFILDPWVTGNHVSYQVQYVRRDRFNELDGFQELANEPEVRVGSFLGQNGRVGGLFAITSIRSERDGVTLSPDNRDVLPEYGFYLGYDSRDLWSAPRYGWWNELQITRSNVLDTDSDFWRFIFDVRRYHTWEDRHTISLTSLATLQTGTVGVDIPIYSDFHIGGTNTIRGYELDSRSGKNQFINTAEYRYMLVEPQPVSVSFFSAYIGIQLASFVDFGQAWDLGDEFTLNQFISGYGLGLRLLIPFVDEVRLDVAWGQPGLGPTFHFGIFPKAVMQRVRVR